MPAPTIRKQLQAPTKWRSASWVMSPTLRLHSAVGEKVVRFTTTSENRLQLQHPCRKAEAEDRGNGLTLGVCSKYCAYEVLLRTVPTEKGPQGNRCGLLVRKRSISAEMLIMILTALPNSDSLRRSQISRDDAKARCYAWTFGLTG